MNFKKFYSKYYNLVYKNKNYKSEVNYISRILKSEKKNIKNILELGSGTGAHAMYLLKKGFNHHENHKKITLNSFHWTDDFADN